MDAGVNMRMIEASVGNWLTNGDVFGKVIYLGVNDSPDNWREISESEYMKKLEAKEREAIDR